MDQIRQALSRLQTQLAGLSATQKMLLGSLAVIVVMTLLYWGHFAGGKEMSPLLVTTLSVEEQTRVTQALQSRNIPFELQNGRIMVPTDRTMDAWAELSFQGALPSNSQQSFEQMLSVLDKVNLFDSSQVVGEKFKLAQMGRLQGIISRWKPVASVSIEINNTNKAGVVRHADPSATIAIETRPNADADPRQLAEAAADTVTGTISGMKRSNVYVTIDHKSVMVKDRDEMSGVSSSEIMRAQNDFAHSCEEKLEVRFSYITGIRILVTAKINGEEKTELRETYDPDKTVQTPMQEDKDHTETRDATNGGEAGAVPNMGISGTQTPATGSGSTTDSSKITYQVSASKSTMNIRSGAGEATVVGVSVGVPHSYLVDAWKVKNPLVTAPPSDVDLQTVASDELSKIETSLKTQYQLADNQVTVSEFPDIPVAAPTTPASGGSSAKDVGGFIGGYGKEVAVGALALVSLFMVTRLVKKSAPPPPPKTSEEIEAEVEAEVAKKAALAQLEGADPVAGEVKESGTVLVGQELDPEAVEAKQMLEQVQALVKQNPDAAAQLVRRWMSRT